VHKHVGGPVFWDKYTAHPYVGCANGCEFCYLRGAPYVGRRDPDDLDRVIRVKTNAVDRLRRELPRLPPDVVGMDGWQWQAETRYRLARGMLEVVRDLGLPLMIIERSPLLLRDLDLLQEINHRAWVGVALSFSNVDPALKRAFEPKSPGLRRRLLTMEALARAGITVGMALMPVIPLLGDSPRQLEDAVKATKDHGGAFVVVGAMTMEGNQAERTLRAAVTVDPGMESAWRELFQWPEGGKPTYGPPGEYVIQLGRTVRELCVRHGILDHTPRYIPPGPLGLNKRLAERLFVRMHELELEGAPSRRIWAYRKAAWAVDEATESVAEVYRRGGVAGLRALPGLDSGLAGHIARWLDLGAPERSS
jgi:DNA repair photolyase